MKCKLLYSITLLFGALFASSIHGHEHQHQHQNRELEISNGEGGVTSFCGTESPSDEQKEATKTAMDTWMKANQGIKSPRQTAVYNVKVYWHVIKKDEVTETISDADIASLITFMNQEFSGFTFESAGTDRTVNAIWYEEEELNDMRTALKKGTKADLDVYFVRVCKSPASVGCRVGYAQFAGAISGGLTDDVIMSFPGSGDGTFPDLNSIQLTIIHEVKYTYIYCMVLYCIALYTI
jgi:hypothetical protein